MQKLALDVEVLRVQTFSTSAPAPQSGTARGAAGDGEAGSHLLPPSECTCPPECHWTV